LTRLRALLAKGLTATEALWPDIAAGYALVHEAASILGNVDGAGSAEVSARYDVLLADVRHQADAGRRLEPALRHFLKVTASYRAGLFACYDVEGLPRTNNGLEQLFGSVRYHERRSTGRKGASPSLVLRGSVRVVTSLVTRLWGVPALSLSAERAAAWRGLRAGLERRRSSRAQRCRFRRDSAEYLRRLENLLLHPTLPS